MSLRTLLNLEPAQQVAIIKVEPSNLVDSTGKPYYIGKLAKSVTVRCSVDKAIDPFETDEVLIREEDLENPEWKLVTEGKPEDGVYVPKWVVDFSKGQEMAIYQETTIQQWAKENRGSKRDARRSDINARIAEKMKNKK